MEEGESAQATGLAEEIISAQEDEISQMQDMLKG